MRRDGYVTAAQISRPAAPACATVLVPTLVFVRLRAGEGTAVDGQQCSSSQARSCTPAKPHTLQSHSLQTPPQILDEYDVSEFAQGTFQVTALQQSGWPTETPR